ncbi:unnamed protein product, partial [marine sediment metagenome]
IIALGTPDELIRNNFEEKAIQFELEYQAPEAFWMGLPGTTRAAIEGNDVVLYSNNIPVTMSAVLQLAEEKGLTGQLRDLRVREATLEDVFLKITGRRIRE